MYMVAELLNEQNLYIYINLSTKDFNQCIKITE